MTSFIFLTYLPTFSLLSTFYNVRPTTVIMCFAITLLATGLPFALLRRPAPVHDLSHVPTGAVPNRGILQDRLTALYTTVAASSIYAVLLYISYATWLPAWLVVYFDDIPDITAVHAGPAGLPVLFLSLIPAGWAARDFLFVSSTGVSSPATRSSSSAPSGPTKESPEKETTTSVGVAMNEPEYFAEIAYRKTFGQLSAKTRTLIWRTLFLAAMIVLNTTVQGVSTIHGVNWEGAVGWGSIWAVATVAIGLTFGWIEAVEGV